MQLSLVSYYGEKPESLRRLILSLQQQLSRDLGEAFRPYALEQVHGTITGIETAVEGGEIYSKWYTENRGRKVPIDLEGLTAYLQSQLPNPKIRIGGYRPEEDYGFTSRGQHPFLRSFSIQGNIAVAMGWPVAFTENGPAYNMDLFALRTAFERFHLCHKWNRDDYQDNDFFFVLGKLNNAELEPAELENIVQSIRQLLATQQGLITLVPESLSVVAYTDTELPLESTQVFPVTDPDLDLDLRQILISVE
ncbi:MAG: hypothetical protein R2824_25375 [Saprospiraceae bacterium]|nr:hypothetical protein [Lewinella sp.]